MLARPTPRGAREDPPRRLFGPNRTTPVAAAASRMPATPLASIVLAIAHDDPVLIVPVSLRSSRSTSQSRSACASCRALVVVVQSSFSPNTISVSMSQRFCVWLQSMSFVPVCYVLRVVEVPLTDDAARCLGWYPLGHLLCLVFTHALARSGISKLSFPLSILRRALRHLVVRLPNRSLCLIKNKLTLGC